MPLPSNITTITLAGTFLDTSGNALSGSITFAPPPELLDAGNAILYGAPVTAALDSSGHFSVTLICTDNPALLPVGWSYTVTEHIAGTRTYQIYLPHSLGSTADLSNVVPALTLSGSVPVPAGSVAPGYGGLAYNNVWTGTNTFTGPLTLPGGSVTPLAWFNLKSYGAVGNGTADDTAAWQNALAAIAAAGSGALYVPPGTYATTGILIHAMSNFQIIGDGGVLTLLPNTSAAPNRYNANALSVADSSDFTISGLIIDGRRDTLAPLAALAANAASGQPSVQLANGAAAAYVAGQRMNLCGGLTANSGNEKDQQDAQLVIQSITPGTGGGNDTVTFTTNLAHSYTAATGSAISDAYGPYAAGGAYITPWQTGTATVAGRTLTQEDQQQGIHLLNCTRFTIAGCTVRGVWESGIRCGTHDQAGGAQADGCSHARITGNRIYHCYDQGIGLWCSPYITVDRNEITSAGWAGICMTLSDDDTVIANTLTANTQRIPGDNHAGYGIAIEGGARNKVIGNTCTNNYSSGLYLTAGGTLLFGGAAQQATTITSGSNAVALPTATLNVAATATFASAGQVTVMSSAGAQQITYTGKTGTTLTGCTGGLGTLYTGNKVTQYPVFTNNGAALDINATTSAVSDGTKFQAGGHYSIVDGPRTERVDTLSIAANTVTLANPTVYRHSDQCQISQAICEDNELVANTITGGTDAGIRLPSAVRTLIQGNTIVRPGLRGIDLGAWTSGGLQPPYSTVVSGNSIQAPDTTGDGNGYSAIFAVQTSDLQITENRMTGAINNSGSFIALLLQAVSDSTIAKNCISDAYAVGLRVDVVNEWVSRRLQIRGNSITRCYGEGVVLWGGDALTFEGNLICRCASQNGPGGYGGQLDIRGVANSRFAGNTVINGGHGGVGLDSATIQGTTVYCTNNVLAENIVRDDGANRDPWNGAAQTQGSGIKELSAGQGPNTYLNNQVSGNSTNWSISSTGNTLRGNQNFNPVGKFSGQPAVPATTVAYTNTLNADATAFITGGTVTAIAIGGQNTGLTAGAFRVPAGQSITLTYSAAPTWVWFGD